MKKIISVALILCMMATLCVMFASCNAVNMDGEVEIDTSKTTYKVGVCQLVEHPFLSLATEGFVEELTKEIEAAGKKVEIDIQKASGEPTMCTTIVTKFIAKDVDLILANATPALLAAANATSTIPVLGTSVTDYEDTFNNNIPKNVSGTSDAVKFDDQAQMMIDSLGLKEGDLVGVIYCSNESNSKVQFDKVTEYFNSKGIQTKAYTFAETTQLASISQKAANDCKAIFIPSDNTVTENQGIVSAICNEELTPVFTSYGGDICYASLAINYKELGRVTGKMAADVLLGRKEFSELSITTIDPIPDYNENICNLLGIAIPENEE